MSGKVGQKERLVPDRVVELITDRLDYEYLGSWQDRVDTKNIELSLLELNLEKAGTAPSTSARRSRRLVRAAAVSAGHDLYDANNEVYDLLVMA